MARGEGDGLITARDVALEIAEVTRELRAFDVGADIRSAPGAGLAAAAPG